MSGRVRPLLAHLHAGRGGIHAIVGVSVAALLLLLPTSTLAAGPDAPVSRSTKAVAPRSTNVAPETASSRWPSLRMISPSVTVNVGRIPGEPIYADPGVYLSSHGGSWQVNLTRPHYGPTIDAVQVGAATASGRLATRDLPAGMASTLNGLDDFFRVSIRNAGGQRVAVQHLPFCPSGTDQRTDGTGPLNASYPRLCYLNPFSRGAVIGIDKGWATSALGYTGLRFHGPNGNYQLKLSITRPYRRFFAIPSSDAVANVTLHVTKVGGCDPFCPPGGNGPHPGRTGGSSSTGRGPTAAPTTSSPPASTLPDLIALPAWNINIETVSHRDYLDFAATVWNAGPAPLMVEGYRRQDQPKMSAWQYFSDANGHISGRLRVGELHYDARPGHEHWHFEQFARYSLLDARRKQVVLSEKEAFCLAPTDAIDMTVPQANWIPYSTGLATACGTSQSLWVREVLPTGWGDTYLQSLPGQSFDITDLPNGTYYISIAANPSGVLFERNRGNDVQLRKITLTGSRGSRHVSVAPWHGISD